MASIAFDRVGKVFEGVEALRGVTASVPDGRFVVLLGPSGCGKSTLLRLVAGLEEITSGDIAIDGQSVAEVAPRDRDVAMVFQNYALYPHRTVRQNLAFALRLRRAPRDEIVKRVGEVARMLGLQDLLDRYPRQLSGGQRQRVAMGRAMVRQPRAFLFDEPLSNLDAKLRVQMRTEIKELHQRVRSTFVYVTHDQVEAMTLADEIIVLNEGRIEQVGAPLELYDRPANRFVAGFIGSPAMNFLAGGVETDGFGARFRAEGGLSFSLAAVPPEAAGDEVVLGLRPEHVKLARIDAGVGAGEEAATVRLVEQLGHETLLVLDAAGVEITALLSRQPKAAAGDRVSLTADPAELHLFSSASGERLG